MRNPPVSSGSKTLWMSLGFEELEEDEDEDSSKKILYYKWVPFFFVFKTFDFLILKFLKFLIVNIMILFSILYSTKCKTIELKESK
jgi:hypothetical protein